MGVNCLVFNGYMEDEYKLQLADLVNRPGQNLKEGQIWVENPGLHLSLIHILIPLGLVWITNSLVTISSLLYGDME